MSSAALPTLLWRARQAADELVTFAGAMARDYLPGPGGERDEVADLYRSRVWTSGLWNPDRRQAALEALEFARHAQAEVASIASWPFDPAGVDPAVVERLEALVTECELWTDRLKH